MHYSLSISNEIFRTGRIIALLIRLFGHTTLEGVALGSSDGAVLLCVSLFEPLECLIFLATKCVGLGDKLVSLPKIEWPLPPPEGAVRADLFS